MRALLDVNILVALWDRDHVHHERARGWWNSNHQHGWASCPLTQGGFLRLVSNQLYPRSLSVARAIGELQILLSVSGHEFWPDDVSIVDSIVFDHRHILGRNQITDFYLLAIAVKRGGRLVTLDHKIAKTAVRGATPDHLVAL